MSGLEAEASLRVLALEAPEQIRRLLEGSLAGDRPELGHRRRLVLGPAQLEGSGHQLTQGEVRSEQRHLEVASAECVAGIQREERRELGQRELIAGQPQKLGDPGVHIAELRPKAAGGSATRAPGEGRAQAAAVRAAGTP